jgi:hypothetical protein
MQIQTKQFGIFAGLALLMLITRGSHFGSSFAMPDATLAIFLITGFLQPRYSFLSLLAFVFLLLEAGGIDYYAINVAGVSDYCISPAYWFLIPTYASMWFGGRWLATRQQNFRFTLVLFGGVSMFSASIAFLISNGSFYLFSGRFSNISVTEYFTRVAQYYLPYIGGSMMYLMLAVLAYTLTGKLNKHPSEAVSVQKE